jgi:hypothetical protein
MWDKISVKQFQMLSQLDLTNSDQLDVLIQVIAIVKGINVEQVEALSLHEFNKANAAVQFIFNSLPEKKVIKRWKNYRFTADITKVPHGVARYVELKHFAKEYIPNMHLMLASMVVPERKTWLRYKALPYDNNEHGNYANDLQDMPVTIALGWVGFFLSVLEKSKENSIRSLKVKLQNKIMMKHLLTRKQAIKIVDNSWQYLDGSIK